MKSLKSSYIKRYLEPGKVYKDPKYDEYYQVNFIKGKGNYATKCDNYTGDFIDLSKEDILTRFFKREKDKNRLHLRWKAQKECLKLYVSEFGKNILQKIENEYDMKLL